MTILTTIPNNASFKDIRDTWNGALADIALLKQGAVAPLPTVYFDQPTISASEGNSGTKVLTMTLLRSTSVGAIAVTANFVQGSAGAADFAGNALPGAKVFTFADGATSATATVSISGDTDVESDETFGYQLVAPSGYALGSPNSLTGTILNDDSAPTPTVTLSAATSSASEGNAGTTLSWVYTVTRSTGTGTASVPWSFAAGTTDAADWSGGTLPAGGAVAFAAGETSKTFSVISAGDTTVEPNETFSVTISAPSGYAAGAAMSATGTIVNDDAPAATAPTGFAMNGSTNPKMKAGLARVTGGTGRMKVAFVGDSTTAGVGGGLTSGTGNNAAQSAGARPYRPSAVFAAQMAAAGYPAADIGQYADNGVSVFGASLPSYDPRIGVGSPAWAWQSSMDFAGGGYTKTATGAFTFAHPDPVDRYELYFLTQFGVTISLYIDDVAVPNANITIGAGGSKSGSTISISSDPSGFCKVNISVARGVHTLKMVASSDGGLMQSVRAWDSTVSAIDVLNLAAAGEQSMHAKESPSPYDWTLLNMLGAEAPDLTVVNLGLNDANANVSASTYTGHLQRIITKAKAYGDVLLVSPHSASAGFAPIATQQALRDAAAAVAASNNVAYMDLSAGYSSWTAAEQAYADDTVHLRRQGYAKVGQLYRQCIQAMAV